MKEKFDVKADLIEELDSVVLAPEGSIPLWLSGSLIRNGPINISVNGESNSHWFDGLAMLHAFAFEQGAVRYSNKFLRTEAYTTVFEKGSLHYPGFATDPCRSLFKRLFTWFVPHTRRHLPNANINIVQLAKEYVALTEVPLPVRFDLTTLETLGVFDYHDRLPQEKCWESAHPHTYENRIFNYLIQYGSTSHYVLYRFSNTASERQIIARIPVEEPAYMHSFALTEHYVIFAEYPFVVKPLDFITKDIPFIDNFIWKPDQGTRFTVINRQDGTLHGTYKTKPFFAFHHVNAFEKEKTLYLDIVCYDDPLIIQKDADYFKTPSEEREKQRMRLERFALSLDVDYVSSEILFEGPIEFPRINGTFDGQPYRYVYLADPRDPFSQSDLRSLYKFDTFSQEAQTWSELGCYPGEPVFVSSPSSTQEDEGVILSLVLDLNKKTSFLLILDAKTFQELGRATAPHSIPPGLHGQFFS